MGLKKIQQEAQENNAQSMVKLGRLYLSGVGVDLDEKEAYQWFEKASNLNNAEAKTYLAYMYANGIGVKEDPKKALDIYLKASELGDATASYTLGVIYKKGLCDEEIDMKKAQEFFEKAAKLNHPGAQYELALPQAKEGFMLMDKVDAESIAKGSEIFKKVEPIFKKAADLNIVPAKYALAILYSKSQDVEKQKMSSELFKACAKENINSAYMALAYIYDKGIGVEQDYWKSLRYYQRAYERGNKKAILNIIYANIMGLGCKQSYQNAINMSRDAVNAGVKEANYFAGVCFKHGLSVDKNLEKAEELFSYAADAKYPPALYQLGVFNDPFYGIGKDGKMAVRYYTEAYELGMLDAGAELARIKFDEDKAKYLKMLEDLAKADTVKAAYYLAEKYSKGEDVAKDDNKAFEYYKKAACLGLRSAINKVVEIAQKKGDKALVAEYKAKNLEGMDFKQMVSVAEDCMDVKNYELAAYCYAMSAQVADSSSKQEKILDLIGDKFEKGEDGIWKGKE